MTATTEKTYGGRDFFADQLLAQIGRMNILAISGGRIERRDTGLTLKVGAGYSVTIDLADDDTYTVRRIFQRNGKTFTHGERTDVYADEVGEVAYQASCFRNGEFA